MTSDGSSLGHLPDGAWQFDDAVTECFDDMLQRSIPQYQVMRDLCFAIGKRFQQDKTDIVDLGASRGEAVAPFIREFGALNHFVLAEISEPMTAVLEQRFAGLIECGVVEVKPLDLRHEFPGTRACLVLSVLLLQFTPIEYRKRIVKNVYDCLLPGGAFIVVEKVSGMTADIDDLMVAEYLAMKAASGYSETEIAEKRKALEGSLVLLDAEGNERLLERSGFRQVDCFWRWMNFAGWVAIK